MKLMLFPYLCSRLSGMMTFFLKKLFFLKQFLFFLFFLKLSKTLNVGFKACEPLDIKTWVNVEGMFPALKLGCHALKE